MSGTRNSGRRAEITGIFDTREELDAAVIAARKSGECIADTAARLGLHGSQYHNVMRRLTRDGRVHRLRERGAVVVHRLNHEETITVEDMRALLDLTDVLRVPPRAARVVEAIRRLLAVRDERHPRKG